MSSRSNPFVLHTLASLACVAFFLIAKPAGLSWWRILLAVIFCATLGHQLVKGLLAMRPPSKRGWIELLGSVQFVFLILAVLLLPQPSGWVLLVAGYLWPPVVRFCMK